MNSSDPVLLARLMGLMCDAIALRAAQQYPPALAALDQGLALDFTFLPLYMQKADLQQEMGDLAAAVDTYAACLDVLPTYDEARLAHRAALAQLAQQYEEMPGEGGQQEGARLLRLARVRYQLGQPQAALAVMERALPLLPQSLECQALHADILLELNRHEDALCCYPEHAGDDQTRALHAFNRADILRRMGCIDEAQAGYEQALRWHSDFPEAEVGLAHMLLSRQAYAAGWRAHEARFRIDALARRHVASSSARWQPGESVRGKRVLLWAEQGQGDTLQFARYIAVVAQQAAQVTLCAPASLLAVLAPSFPQVQCVATVAEAGPHEAHASLMSLPLLLDLPDPREGPQAPYLVADAARVAYWREVLAERSPAATRRPRIGIAWAGRQYATLHPSRDLPLADLLPLFALPVDVVSLQVEIPRADQPTHDRLADRLHTWPLADWADTAALACTLDLVISVDTAVAHLAGALGLPCFLPQRLEGEWRWGVQGDSSPWYPSLRLFRQRERGQWAPVVEELRLACRERFAGWA